MSLPLMNNLTLINPGENNFKNQGTQDKVALD